jgi:hypothetical protein
MTHHPPPADPNDSATPTDMDTALHRHLSGLASALGYEFEAEDLGPFTGHHPALVIAWALAAAHHASLTFAQRLLDDPIEFLESSIHSEPADEAGYHADLLADLRDHHAQLSARITRARDQYAARCHDLTHTGLTWATGDPTPPTAGA